MGKPKTELSLGNRDAYVRMNFLHQAAHLTLALSLSKQHPHPQDAAASGHPGSPCAQTDGGGQGPAHEAVGEAEIDADAGAAASAQLVTERHPARATSHGKRASNPRSGTRNAPAHAAAVIPVGHSDGEAGAASVPAASAGVPTGVPRQSPWPPGKSSTLHTMSRFYVNEMKNITKRLVLRV
jgi:hypothetical protein